MYYYYYPTQELTVDTSYVNEVNELAQQLMGQNHGDTHVIQELQQAVNNK